METNSRRRAVDVSTRKSSIWSGASSSFLASGVALQLACGPVDRIASDVQRAVTILEQTRKDINQQADDWENLIQRGKDELIQQDLPRMAERLDSIKRRGIAEAGTEIRCEMDFIGHRIADGIDRLVAELLGDPLPPRRPFGCQVDPPSIDVARVLDNTINVITMYGWNMEVDAVSDGSLFVELSGVDIPPRRIPQDAISVPTHYLMTIRVSGDDVGISDNSRQLTLYWNEEQIASIGVNPRPPERQALRCGQPVPSPNLHEVKRDDGDCDRRCSTVSTWDYWCRCQIKYAVHAVEPNGRLSNAHLECVSGSCSWNGRKSHVVYGAGHRTASATKQVGSRRTTFKLCATETWRAFE